MKKTKKIPTREKDKWKPKYRENNEIYLKNEKKKTEERIQIKQQCSASNSEDIMLNQHCLAEFLFNSFFALFMLYFFLFSAIFIWLYNIIYIHENGHTNIHFVFHKYNSTDIRKYPAATGHSIQHYKCRRERAKKQNKINTNMWGNCFLKYKIIANYKR